MLGVTPSPYPPNTVQCRDKHLVISSTAIPPLGVVETAHPSEAPEADEAAVAEESPSRITPTSLLSTIVRSTSRLTNRLMVSILNWSLVGLSCAGEVSS